MVPDPLQFLAGEPIPLSEPPETEILEHPVFWLAKHTGKTGLGCLHEQLRQQSELSRIRRSDGKPIFTGLGFYPEMGADTLWLVNTCTQGRLVGMCMHEGEMIAGAGLLEALKLDPSMVFGNFIKSGPIRRDIEEALQYPITSEHGEGIRRIKYAHERIGYSIGERDWRKMGRYLTWEHFTFIPSVSGDETILSNILGGGKFDYAIFKGMEYHRFLREDLGQEEITSWVSKLDHNHLASDAVAVVAEHEETTLKTLHEIGYESIGSTVNPARPPEIHNIPLSDMKMENNLPGVQLEKFNNAVMLISGSRYHVLQRRK
ncbi:MAG: hypothetical protein GF416_04990 [Candidatus Altiarchaeales archaeon]|nr:hypothetical protein [Candidatus Altiarchaeales archaeon]MBD3416473.1 hypothetical protein [Candidatus Altiarchaeales archaeon]